MSGERKLRYKKDLKRLGMGVNLTPICYAEKFIKLVSYDFFLQFCKLFVISLLQQET